MATEASKQVAAQCDAVVHMATCIADIHEHKAQLFRDGIAEVLVDLDGRFTHRLMETLGDILNEMDAVTKEDARLDPVFEEAEKRWPIHESQAAAVRAAENLARTEPT